MRRPILILTLLALAACGGGEEADPPDASTPEAGATGTVAITSPSDGAWRTHNPVLVSGSLDGLVDGPVTVNGLPALVEGGAFSALVHLEEGEVQLTAVHEASGASDSITLQVDTLPPALSILTPARSTILADPVDGLLVQATAGDENSLQAVQIEGVDVPGLGNAFEDRVYPEAGVSSLVAQAIDVPGNTAREHRSVMTGPFVPCQALDDRPTAVLTLGAQALSTIAAAAATELEELDFAGLLDPYNPLYESDALTLSLHQLDLRGLLMEPVPGDRILSLTVAAEKIFVQGELQMKNKPVDIQATLTDPLFHVVLRLEDMELTLEALEVQGGTLDLSATDAAGQDVVPPVQISGAFLDFTGELLSAFLSDFFTDRLINVSAFTDDSWVLELFGLPVEIRYQVLSIDLNPSGVRLNTAGAVLPHGEETHPWTHGCLDGPLDPPPPDDYPGLRIHLSQPFLNRLLLDIWRQGYMDLVADQALLDGFKAEIALVCGMLGTLLPHLPDPPDPEDPLAVTLTPGLPPTLTDASNLPGGLRFALGDMELGFSCAGAPASRAWLSLAADVRFDVAAGALQPLVSFSDLLIDLDDLPTDAKRLVEAGVEVGLETTLNELLTPITASLAELYLPAFFGCHLVDGSAGAGDGWFRIEGTLKY